MVLKKYALITLSLILLQTLVVPANLPQNFIRADVGCSVSVSPSSIRGGAVSAVTYSVLNQDEFESLVQVNISTTATDEFQLQSASGSGWSATMNGGNSVSFTEGVIAPGQTATFTLNLQAVDQDQASIQWDVLAGASPDGSGMASCSGSSAIAIYKSTSTTGATLYNTGTTGITTTEATISWTTSTASTSLIEYGTSSSYGSTKSSSTLASSHTLTLTGLSASTTYHFRVTSVDGQGNTVTSSDYTFSTSGAGSTTTSTTVITPTPSPTQTPTPTPIPDRTKPTVSLKTSLVKPVKVAPKIEGEASDNKGVTKVEYSLDGGSNWIESTLTLAKNSITKASFSFQPPQNLEDGNYVVQVRATDTSGNTALSTPLTMIIDRLDPQIGPHMVHIGPLLLEPQGDGEYLIPSDTLTSLTFSAIGGPTSVIIRIGNQIVSAKKHIYSGLWKARFSLPHEGRFEVLGTATDGAGNVTSRSLGFVSVQSKGHVGTPADTSQITVFVKQSQLNDFVKWDGEPYGIQNPMKIGENGRYSLILPAGTYYLHISSSRTIPTNSDIFTLSQPTIISQEFVLEPLKGFRFGPFMLNFLDLWHTNSAKLHLVPSGRSTQKASRLVGTPFPSFTLSAQNGVLTELAIRGNATVMTVLSSWSPANQVQLSHLDQIDISKARIIALFPHETEGSVVVNKNRGGYRTEFLADKDGVLFSKLDVQSIPTHYFVDRQGIIRKVIVGVLTKEEVMHNLIY